MTAIAAGHVLVVGYGNPLRGDDGAGPAVARALLADPRFRGADVRVQHQLTPELASDVAGASLVVLVDASEDVAPGEVVVRRVGAATDDASAWSHHVDPAGLAGLAAELWGVAPPMFAVCVGPSSMEVGEGLSPLVASALPAAVDAVVGIVEADRDA